MTKSFSVFVLTVCLSSQALAAPVSSPPCADTDLKCVIRLLDQKNEEAKSWARENGLLKQQVDLFKQENLMLKADSDACHAVVQPAIDAAKAVQRPWWESPSFLIPVGVGLGVALTVLAVWGASQLRVVVTQTGGGQ